MLSEPVVNLNVKKHPDFLGVAQCSFGTDFCFWTFLYGKRFLIFAVLFFVGGGIEGAPAKNLFLNPLTLYPILIQSRNLCCNQTRKRLFCCVDNMSGHCSIKLFVLHALIIACANFSGSCLIKLRLNLSPATLSGCLSDKQSTRCMTGIEVPFKSSSINMSPALE